MEGAPIPGLDERTATPVVTKFVEVQQEPEKVLKRTVRGFIRSPSGRDSFLRTVQYTLRLVLLYRLRSNPPKPSFRPSRSIQTSFAIVSLFSALRRLLALQTVIQSLRSLTRSTNPFKHSASTRAGHPPLDGKLRQISIDYFLQLTRSTLDLVAVLTDNLYLGSKLSIIPSRWIDKTQARKIDKISDLSTLGSVLIGFLQVQQKRNKLKSRGNEKRIKAIRAEKELEELEFWEGTGQGNVKTQERVEEERKLRERVRYERGKLRKMREELGGLRWEKWRLSAEGIFAIYDVLDLQIGRELTKSWTGVSASLIEASQSWSEYVKS